MKQVARSKAAPEAAALSVSSKNYSYRLLLSVCLAVLTGYCIARNIFRTGVFVLVLLNFLFAADIIFKNAWHDIEKGRFSTSLLTAFCLLCGLGYCISKTFLPAPLAGRAPDLYIPLIGLIILYLWHSLHLVRGKERTDVFIKKLDDFLPKSGRLIQDKREMMVFACELKPGELIKVKAGERIPCEGIIESGETTIDESLITGNMMPASKRTGSVVYAGTLNKGADIRVRVEKNIASSSIAGIIESIKHSERRRCIRYDVLDKYASWILCCAVLFALGVYIFFYWAGGYTRPYHSFGDFLLVMGLCCPWSFLFCAGLPGNFLHMGARRYKIDLNAMGALEGLEKADTVFFDKTGTLTYGELRVASVHTITEDTRAELLTCLATAEQKVDGPFAAAIVLYTGKEKIEPKEINCLDVLPGKGVRAGCGKDVLLAGRPEWLREQGIEVTVGPHERQAVVCAAKNGKYLGYVLLDDQLRPDAAEMVQSLQARGKEVILMSGDNEEAVRAIAKETGIEKYNFDVLPQTKAEILGNYSALGRKTVMVGDGFNDIVALLRCEAGVVFSSGKNVYNNWVDVVIRRSDLHSVVTLFAMHKELSARIGENVLLSILCNSVLLAVLLFAPSEVLQQKDILPLGLVVGVLLVVLNSMRLLHIK